jgi:hypothetical protein
MSTTMQMLLHLQPSTNHFVSRRPLKRVCKLEASAVLVVCRRAHKVWLISLALGIGVPLVFFALLYSEAVLLHQVF